MSNINHANRIAREKMQVAAQKGAMTDVKRDLADLDLNERQLSFIAYYMDGLSVSEASAKAGYTNTTSQILLRSPRMQAAMARLLDRFLVGQLAPEALRQLNKMLLADRTADGVRKDIAFGLLDRAGFTAKRFDKLAPGEQDISSMSAADLRAALAKIDSELTGRMRDVTPNSEPMTSDELDMYS